MPNELIHEKSPYLLQHAHNPVNWYPWGKEAFEKAASENKPIFLSIGYSTCHWCHVMENESFEDSEVAALLNADFVCIKVDREERPDVDAVYMNVCQAMTGQGGWPLTILMSADQKPFFAATYLPKQSRYGLMGMTELLPKIAQIWKNEQDKITKAGKEITEYLQQKSSTLPQGKDAILSLPRRAFDQLSSSFDEKNGGFGASPKFPTPHNLLFLLAFGRYEKDPTARTMVEKTLLQMYRGGIFDHIGGGFSRYSTDEKWLVPHFEKMLYDNALLAYSYLEAYRATHNTLFLPIAKSILHYVLTELTHETGGFFCGQDADSDGVEGKFYIFEPKEIQSILGEDKGMIFNSLFDITERGNFEGKSIPNLLQNAQYADLPPEIPEILSKLYVYRKQRAALHKDDKILTAWNGLMIAALAKASVILQNDLYLAAAKKAARFLLDTLCDERGVLKVRWRDGEAAGEGKLDDYAFLCWGLLELYNATLEPSYLQSALLLANRMMDAFFDYKNGGFYLYANDGEQLIARPKEIYDGAMPSGNSVAASVLLHLSLLTAEETWRKLSEQQLSFLAANTADYPSAHTFAIRTILQSLSPSMQLICVASSADYKKIVSELLHEFFPYGLTVLFLSPQDKPFIEELCPFVKDYPLPENGIFFYLCENNSCLSPFSDVSALREHIKTHYI